MRAVGYDIACPDIRQRGFLPSQRIGQQRLGFLFGYRSGYRVLFESLLSLVDRFQDLVILLLQLLVLVLGVQHGGLFSRQQQPA